MKDTKEIVLFFEEGKSFEVLDVAKELINRFKVIGNPLILPENKNNKVPLIVFNESNDMQIQVSKSAVTILISQKYFGKLASIIFDIVDIFDAYKIRFIRIGCISSIFLNPDKIEVAIDRFLKRESFDDKLENFNISWYHKLSSKYGDINIWERIIKDSNNFSDLLMQYDFNSIVGDKINLDMKYIKEFIKVSSEFIDSRVDF